jgi:alpha-glucosidase
MPKIAIIIAILILFNNTSFSNGNLVGEIQSPDKRTRVAVDLSDGKIQYSVYFNSEQILLPSAIQLVLLNGASTLSVRKITEDAVRSMIVSPVPEKRRNIPDEYNQLAIRFREPFTLQFRVYNDGIAYRWITHFKDSITVSDEISTYQFRGDPETYYNEVEKRPDLDIYHTSFEEPYKSGKLSSLTDKDVCFSPLLVRYPNVNLVLTESDLQDYPGMFIVGSANSQLHADFANYPLQEKITEGEFPQAVVIERTDYIARTKGTRTFPWRLMMIAATDKELPQNDLVYRLGAPSRVPETSWINPGQGTDEWIIGINLFNVPFKAGINTATYKFYIDFAQRFGFERIMMDAGWSDYKDLFTINPDLDMDEISRYAKSKAVKLSMWTLALTLEKQLEPALDQFNKWGVDFIMTDFMDRDDQKMVNFYHRIAEACAKHKIMVMYHGAFKPAGFSRTWPNAVTREGVLGSEYNIWSSKPTPDHNLFLPFIRMTAGPLDYEPGLLDNARSGFRPSHERVMSMGTRCHQLAMFVVYDSPIQIFSGNPSQGLMEPGFMELLGAIPTTWDTTIVTDGKIGDYIISARKKSNDWFIGAMTDSSARELSVTLDFLDEGTYEARICRDGINADRYPSDYQLLTMQVKRNEKLPIKMAEGGGFAAWLRKL